MEPVTTIQDGACSACGQQYDWPDGDAYDGAALCRCQCAICDAPGEGPCCADCARWLDAAEALWERLECFPGVDAPAGQWPWRE